MPCLIAMPLPADWGKPSERNFPFLLIVSAGTILILDTVALVLWLARANDLLMLTVILFGLPTLLFAPVLGLLGVAFGERPRWIFLATAAGIGLAVLLLKFATAHLD